MSEPINPATRGSGPLKPLAITRLDEAIGLITVRRKSRQEHRAEVDPMLVDAALIVDDALAEARKEIERLMDRDQVNFGLGLRLDKALSVVGQKDAALRNALDTIVNFQWRLGLPISHQIDCGCSMCRALNSSADCQPTYTADPGRVAPSAGEPSGLHMNREAQE